MHLIFSILTSLQLFAVTPAIAGIQVMRANWAGADVTEQAQKWCDGKEDCTYKVSSQYLGRPESLNDQSFRLIWKCDGIAQSTKIENIPTPAEGKVLRLKCDQVQVVANAQPAARNTNNTKTTTWNPRSPLQYPSSLHSLILGSNENGVVKTIGEQCTNAIRKLIKEGRNFYSQVMAEEYTLPISKSSLDETKDGHFFHYTNAHEVREIVDNKKYDKIFTFIRQKTYPSDWFFYIAADPYSSARYGVHKVNITLHDNAKMFTSNHKSQAESLNNGHEGDVAVEQELLKNNPDLSSCSGQGGFYGTGHNHPILSLLAAEANQIDIIAYFGDDSGWYQMLGFWAIKTMEMGL